MYKMKITVLAKAIDQMNKEVKRNYEEEAPDFPFTEETICKALSSGNTERLEFAINDLKGYVSDNATRLRLLDNVRGYSGVVIKKICLTPEEGRVMFGTKERER